jgi:hypothetical protein
LVEDLGDEVSFFGRRDQRVEGGIASTLFLQKQKAKQKHRQSGDDDQNHRSGDPLPAFENPPVVESNAGPGKLGGRGALSNTFHGRWPVGQEASDWGGRPETRVCFDGIWSILTGQSGVCPENNVVFRQLASDSAISPAGRRNNAQKSAFRLDLAEARPGRSSTWPKLDLAEARPGRSSGKPNFGQLIGH